MADYEKEKKKIKKKTKKIGILSSGPSPIRMGSIALENRRRKKQRQKELMKSAGKGPSNVSQAKMKQGMGKMGIGMKNKGGAILKKNAEKMAYGGMSGGKKHMYVAGGSVKDNPGLKALRASGPKGMEAYKKITGSK